MKLLLPDCKMTFVCGPVSSGKTHLIKQWLATDNRHVIFDGTGEFLEGNDATKREEIWANPRALYERIKANPFYYRIVYQPGRSRTDDFGYVLDALWWIKNSKLLVCDEFHEICPCTEGITEETERMLRFARHAKLGFIGASQRIADVHKLFTSGCRMVVLFWTQEARDLEAIEDRWRCADMVENLRPLLHDDVTGQTKQVPQAVVCMKGQKPFVFDFATDSELAGTEQREREQDDQPAPENSGVEDAEEESDLPGTDTPAEGV